MKSYLVPKKYNYYYKSLDNNSGVKFLKEQINSIEQYKIDLLEKYRTFLQSSSDLVEPMAIVNDIKQFIIERKRAEKNLYRAYNIASKGARGEDKVKDIIYTFDNEWHVISNARLNIEGNNIENDFVIIDESGISTIEVKNIGSSSEKLIIDKLGRVKRVSRFNEEIETVDIISQGNRHLGYLKRFIDKNIDYKVPVNSYIVIASNIRIINKSDFNIIGPNQIYNIIKAQPRVIDTDKVEEVYNLIYDNLIEGHKYQYVDYISVLEENYKLILLSIKEYLESKKKNL